VSTNNTQSHLDEKYRKMENAERKKMIQQGFDTVAVGYDHPSLSFFPETAKRLVEYLQLDPQDRLLDVCTGTGYVALTAAEKLSQGQVFGIDLSSGMLQQAKDKAAEKNLSNTEFVQMDLEHLAFEDGSFDVATSSFGLFFLEDMSEGLANIASAVKPGGKVAITSFAGDAFSPMAEIFLENYKATGRDMPSPSWKRMATDVLLREQFKAVGMTEVTIHHEPLGYHMTSPQMWWDVVWNAGWRTFLNQLTADELKDFKERHLKAIAEVLGEDGVWFNTEVLIAVAEK